MRVAEGRGGGLGLAVGGSTSEGAGEEVAAAAAAVAAGWAGAEMGLWAAEGQRHLGMKNPNTHCSTDWLIFLKAKHFICIPTFFFFY